MPRFFIHLSPSFPGLPEFMNLSEVSRVELGRGCDLVQFQSAVLMLSPMMGSSWSHLVTMQPMWLHLAAQGG